MLAAIDFDDKLFLTADEINNEIVDRFLPYKLQSAQASAAQSKPKLHLCVGRVASQTPLNSDFLPVGTAHGPSPGLASLGHPLPASPGEGKNASYE